MAQTATAPEGTTADDMLEAFRGLKRYVDALPKPIDSDDDTH